MEAGEQEKRRLIAAVEAEAKGVREIEQLGLETSLNISWATQS
jgi:hypothetical protein